MKVLTAKLKPVIVQAVQHTNSRGDTDALMKWCGAEWLQDDGSILVNSPRGTYKCELGDYVLKDSNGRCSVCKKDDFERHYEVNK